MARGDAIYLRRRTWWLDFRHEGKRHVARLGKDIKAHVARELAQVKRAAILRGEAGIGGRKRKDRAFEGAAREFLTWAEANKRPKTLRSYRQCVEQLSKSFAGRRLSAVDPLSIERHKHARIKAGAPVAANRELMCLKALFNRCIEWDLYEGTNPMTKVKIPRERKERPRFLEGDEEDRLLKAAGEPLRTIILSGIYAGLRIEAEALTLRRPQVDLKRSLLTVRAAYAKSGQTRTIPINGDLRATLEKVMQRPGDPEGYVFAKADGCPYRSIRTAFETACRRAGLKNVTPHTLRHTFGSRLAMAGVDLRTIQELGGWASLAMVERYAHLSPTHKVEAVERISRTNFPTPFTTPKSVVGLAVR